MNPSHGGLHVPTNELRLNWYRGLTLSNRSVCEYLLDSSEVPPQLVRDNKLAFEVNKARHAMSVWL